jgi:PAS domain S-box-containing protein
VHENRAEGLAAPQIQQYLLYEAVDESPALVFVADPDMRYLAVNATACRVLGYTREELLALTVPDVAAAPEAPELYGDMRSEGQQTGRTQIRTKDGRLLPFTYRATQVTVAGMTHYVAVGFVDEAG